ncbi:MAG: autotransporter-associated beta strand repeat-containing protein [Akkermansiaceae bacterium]|nr:autotransporter-associated beta strand repeat-containing protein [Akkermansiaceae bacterium]
MKTRRFSLFVQRRHPVAAGVGLAFVLGGHLFAQTLYWDTNGTTAGSANLTSGNNIWGTNNLWSTSSAGTAATGAYVQNSDVVISAGTNATGNNTVRVTGTQAANSITFEEGVVTMSAVTGSSVALSIGAGGITMANGLNGTVTIGGSLGTITLSASQTWTNNTTSTARALTLGNGTAASRLTGSATTGNKTTLTFAGGSTGTTTLNSIIEDGGNGGTLEIVKGGSGTLVLSYANTFSGGLTLNAGTLLLNSATAVGSSVLTLKGGTVGTSASGGMTLSNPVQVWDGNFSVGGSTDLNMGTGAVTLTANRSVAIAGTNASTVTVGGDIGGAFRLTTTNASGSGITSILNLDGNNTYSGGTTVNGGVLRFADAAAIPATGTITMGQNGALSVSGVHSTLAGWIGEAKLATTSVGALALTADSNEAFNPTGFNGLSLGAEVGKTVVYTGTITASTGGYFVGGGGGNIEFSNQNTFTGASALTVGNGGSGTTILSNSNDYAGSTTVRAGVALVLRNGGALGGTAAGTNVSGGGSVQLDNVSVLGEALTLNGTGATASAANITDGLRSLSGSNVWSGDVNVVTGASQNVRMGVVGGELLVSGKVALSGNAGASLVLTGAAGTGTISGVISGTALDTPIIKNGNGTWVLSGENTFTGAIRMDAGVLSVDTIGSAAVAGNLGKSDGTLGFGENTTTGTLRYTGTGETSARPISLRASTTGGGVIEQAGSGELEFSGTVGNVNTTMKTLTLTGSTSGSGKLSGAITGTIGIVKAGTGSWEISNSSTVTPNTFTGAITVNDGKLIGSGGLNSTTAVNLNGGTFVLGADNVVNSAAGVTMAGGALEMAGFSNSFGALALSVGASLLNLSGGESVVTFGPSIALAWTGSLSILGWSSAGGTERVDFTGGLTTDQLAAITFDNPDGFAPGTYTSKLVGIEVVPDALIPEPSAAILAAAGSVVVAFRRRRI